MKKAQTIFNAFVRERDKNFGCISCGGKVEQAGHYFSQGHHSNLRYDQINTNGQCIKCNMFLHGNLIRYRQGLIARLGIEAVEDLEQRADNERLKKWSRTELEEIITIYGKR